MLQKINKFKLFLILVVLIISLVVLKLKQPKTNSGDEKINNTSTYNNEIKNIPTITGLTTPTLIQKKLTPEEMSDLDYDDYIKYIQSLSIEEYKALPNLDPGINEDYFPYDADVFFAEKYEDQKVYVKSKIEDKAKAERALKYWFFIEVGDTLPTSNIVWQ